LFVTYHSDIGDFLDHCVPFFFADDLVAVLPGGIGAKYREQCLDLEKRLKRFFDKLEIYSIINRQPINYAKMEALWSATVIVSLHIEICCGEEQIHWKKSFKYLGYWISPKLGWGK
jgi:hypothetical protein